jgi:3'(2'), 5'-bisphosphate nucleotidase
LPNEAPHAIHVRPFPQSNVQLAGSRSHVTAATPQFMDCLGDDVSTKSMGSSLKICMVAEGVADLYPRLGLTSEWDTAASQCVVEQAGGYLTDLNLNPLLYNTKDSLLNPYFMVFGEQKNQWVSCLKRVQDKL